MIAIVMEIASGRLGLKISERVLVAILSVVVGELADADSAMTGEDLVAMFESLSLDAEISLDVNLGDEISLEVGVDTKYIGLGIAITNPNLTIGVNEAVANAVSAVVASGEYDSYSDSSYARFGLTLDVSYKADATFIKVTEQEAAKYNQSDRYDLVEGSYVQDSNGTYIRRGISFTEVLAVILENLLGDAGIETGTAILDEMLGALLEALGLDFYIDDIIEDNFRINLKGVLDLEALDLQYMLTNLAQRTDYLTEEEWNDKYTSTASSHRLSPPRHTSSRAANMSKSPRAKRTTASGTTPPSRDSTRWKSSTRCRRASKSSSTPKSARPSTSASTSSKARCTSTPATSADPR